MDLSRFQIEGQRLVRAPVVSVVAHSLGIVLLVLLAL